MCHDYLPAASASLSRYQLDLPGFEYGEAFPGSTAPFLSSAAPDRWLPGTFGLMPHWAPPTHYRKTYNARSETVATLPSFRTAWKRRQFCVIPVDAFFEPHYASGRAIRYRIERVDGAPFGLAGIWEQRTREDGTDWLSFSMLTINADAHPFMRQFHKPSDEKRSVVVLPDDTWRDWLTCPTTDAARLFLNDFDPTTMRTWPAPLAPRARKSA